MNIAIASVITALISVSVLYLLIKIWPRTGKMGINLNEVTCPKCSTVLPKTRKPQNLSQILWGGWSCSNCGCKIDKYGKEKNT